MLSINGVEVEVNRFPDTTLLLRGYPYHKSATINWFFENNEELVALIYMVGYLKDHGCEKINLYMPYVPNARQDRVKNNTDVFTLKYFAETINALQFNKVYVVDVHSAVSEALIDRVVNIRPIKYINATLEDLGNIDTVFYPDEGAMKRYSDLIQMPYAFGIKQRHWETGNILGLAVSQTQDRITGNNILIIDDICSKGGTFYHSAKKLKELGAKHIYLYITHCENTILQGEVLTSGLIDKVYTTDSIFTEHNEKITVLPMEQEGK